MKTMREVRGNLHAQSYSRVRAIPKTHITPMSSSWWWIPWHNQEEDVDGQRKINRDIPCLEILIDQA